MALIRRRVQKAIADHGRFGGGYSWSLLWDSRSNCGVSQTWDCVSDLDSLAKGHPCEVWSTVVNEHSIHQLSLPTDRLLALSDVAQQLELEQMFPDPSIDTGDKYLAGLWNCSTLILQLLWQCRAQESVTNNGLTWSWAS